MIVLGIETSCDDTSAALYDGREVMANVISTQLVHRKFGGVVPELASRSHIKLLLPVIEQALHIAGCSKEKLDGIAVTCGPGLAGSLLVGLSFAKGLSQSLNIPFIGINHLEGHIWSLKLSSPGLEPPFMVLLVSGGHTQLVHVIRWGEYSILGRTRDDAAGEAFDKIAKLLGLGYPGGPLIEKKAAEGDSSKIHFPRAFLEKDQFAFSFSGLKTAVLNHVRQIKPEALSEEIPHICAGFQAAVFDVLVEKTVRAAEILKVSKIGIAGGVAVNKTLQQALRKKAEGRGLEVHWPQSLFCTDNGAMIACAGHYYLRRKCHSDLNLPPQPSLNL
jgi:N6-L-threonylcarbamoyladenine synthase